MPTIKELEEFTAHFRTLGNEAGISTERGEPYNALPLPETEPAGNPFANAKNPSNIESPPAENQNDIDFGAFLDTLPDDLQEPPNDLNSPDMEMPDADFNFDDGLGDLLSGFADDIESAQADPEYPPDFTDPGFDDPNVPGNAIDADFEEMPDFTIPEDSSNPDSMDFGDLENLNISDDVSGQDDENPIISDEEMLSLFSEPSEAVPVQKTAEDLSVIDSTDSVEDIPVFEDAETTEDVPSDEDFSFDLDTPLESTSDSADDFGSFDLPDPGSGMDEEFSIPDMDEDAVSGTESSFDASMDLGGESFDLPDPGSGMGEEFSIPDMDEDAVSGMESSFDASMDLGGESFDMPESSPQADSDANIEELDSFDSFSFDGELNETSSFGMPESDLNIDEVAFDDGGELSLDGIDDIFKASADSGKSKKQARKIDTEASADVEEIQLSQEELGQLEKTLTSYPLNLRIACEEMIAEQAVAPELMSELVKKLVNGASPKETAALAGKILGKTIQVPKGFLKKSGEELEAEQSSFGYIFVHSFLPVLRTFAIFALLLFCLGYLSYQFIYIPVRADGMYKRGYGLIEDGEYARANEDFFEALKVRMMKKWFFSYAEAFRDNRQYAFAEQKYDELLRYYPRDKKAALDYAHLETYYLYNYEKANRILQANILDYILDDREGLFAQGENFLAWGEIDPTQLENARVAFARLMERYGEKDIYLEQMLKYFIRTDNLAQVLPLQEYFFASNKTKITAPTLAELGGYLLDKKFEQVQGVPDVHLDDIEGIRDVLLRAVNTDASLPESHYHLARYYSRYGSIQEEQIVLENAIKAFDSAPELSAKRLGFRIDTQRRYAWIQTSTQYFVDAEETLIKGITLYEDALRRRVLPPVPAYGRLYADLADIEYFKHGDFAAALSNYQNAEENGWHPPEVIYRMGSIYYRTDRMADAMEYFFEASHEMPLNRRLLYALGNTSYLRGNYSVAEGYYSRLLDLLEIEKVRATTLLPHDRPEHMDLAERIMEAQNNLGVTLKALADRSGNVNHRTRALALFSESARAWDFITRNPATLVRLFVPGTAISEPNQALLNTKHTLYPEPGFEPLIYNKIDMDVEDPSTWESLVPSSGVRARDIPFEIRNKEWDIPFEIRNME